MNARHIASFLVGKATYKALRFFGRSGDSLPGLLAHRIYPNLLHTLSTECTEGIILICGTNGKTTTSSMIASILHKDNRKFIHNRSGSNMTRGHVSAFLAETNWSGKTGAKLALLEVDEAVLPQTIAQTKPTIIVLHNLFRDQLDRYGEVNSIAKKWLTALRSNISDDCLLVVNADDPNLAYLAVESSHKNVIYYGLDDPSAGTSASTSVVDAYISPASNQPLRYTTYYLSHLGNYTDTSTNFHRPPLTYAARRLFLGTPKEPARFTIEKLQASNLEITVPLPGLYNIYNALAASVVADTMMVDPSITTAALSAFTTVFGRFERVSIGDHFIYLCLIKNPAGASEVVRTIPQEPSTHIAVFANDNFADGLDVSWYFDTPFEYITPFVIWSLFSGTRANDMALRFKYAGSENAPLVEQNLQTAVDILLQKAGTNDIYVLSTYTATLALQKWLHHLGYISSYWKE